MSEQATSTQAGSEEREAFALRGESIGYYARTTPDAPSVIVDDEVVTFAALDRRANQLVRALAERGVGPGSSVAMMVTNRVEFVEAWAAAMRGGLRLTPINWHLTATEAGYIVENCEASAFIGDADSAGRTTRPVTTSCGSRRADRSTASMTTAPPSKQRLPTPSMLSWAGSCSTPPAPQVIPKVSPRLPAMRSPISST
ncbi:MAG: AMP-binding protein [Acidimicrobiales bacterium]|nr:AMP-binding protein [Acidimicrobiales bacterium]